MPGPSQRMIYVLFDVRVELIFEFFNVVVASGGVGLCFGVGQFLLMRSRYVFIVFWTFVLLKVLCRFVLDSQVMILSLASLFFEKMLLTHWGIGFRKGNSLKFRWFTDVFGEALTCCYVILMAIEDERCSEIGIRFFI